METFLVVDDNENFIESLKALWNEILKEKYPNWKCDFFLYKEYSQVNLSEITSVITGRDHILLDCSLIEHNLINLIIGKSPSTKLWMVTGQQEEIFIQKWENWRKNYPQAIQVEWFEKPLNLENILATLDSITHGISTSHTSSLSWTQWPLPCRLLDKNLKPIANNPNWRIALDALSEILKNDQDKLYSRELSILDTWCEKPDSPRTYGQTRFYTFGFGENRYLQVGLSYPIKKNIEIGDAIGEIFSLMLCDKQFTRARYYEIEAVPGSAGVLWLRKSTHKVLKDLPISHPIGKTLNIRFNNYKKQCKNAKRGTLIYKILNSEDDKEDPDIIFWNQVVGAGKSPWIDLPIYIKNQVIGLLIFDRSGRKNDNKDIDDTDDDQITNEMINRLNPKLLSAIIHLRQAIEYQNKKKELIHHCNYANWQQKLMKKTREDEHSPDSIQTTFLEDEIIKKAKKDTGATTVMLAIRPPAAHYMEVRASYNKQVLRTNELRLPLNRPHFIAVQCAKAAKPVFVTNYGEISDDKRISQEDWQTAIEHLGLGKIEYEQCVTQCQNWLRDIKSIAALPIKYDEQVLGVLVLCHKSPFYFTYERIRAAQALIRYAHPYLHQSRIRTARDAWDSMLMHTFRTYLADIRNQADEIIDLASSSTDAGVVTLANRIIGRTEYIIGLSNQVMYLLGYKYQNSRTSYKDVMPITILKKIWETLCELPEAKDKYLEIDSDSVDVPLKDTMNCFEHILSVLTNNAVKYGQAGPIHIKTSLEGHYWKLILINRGRFSDSTINRNFIKLNLSSREDLGQKSLTVHIGLAVTFRLLEETKGSLSLSNEKKDGHDYAKAELCWPTHLES